MIPTPSNNPAAGFFIGVGCPGCGGDLELEADFFVITCKHCGSILRVVKPGTPVAYLVKNRIDDMAARFHLDRYLKERGEPLTGSGLMFKRLYYPYWKVDGLLLKLRNKTESRTHYSEYNDEKEYTVESDKTSVSVSPYSLTVGAGMDLPSVPDSLGVRTDHVTIVPYSRENVQDGFDTIAISRSQEEIVRRIGLAVAAIGEMSHADFGTNVTRLYDPVFSMVYFPYLVIESYDPEYRRFALDGLTGRVLGHLDAQGSQLAARSRLRRDSFDYSQSQEPSAHSSRSRRASSNAVSHLRYQGVSDELVPIDADHDQSAAPIDVTFGELQVDFHRCTNCGVDLPPQMSFVYVCNNCHTPRLLNNARYTLTSIEQVDGEVGGHTKLIPFWWFRLRPEQSARLGVLMGGMGKPDRLVVPALRSKNFEAIHRLAKRMTTAATKMPSSRVDELDERCLAVRISLTEAVAHAEMIVARELLMLGKRGADAEVTLEPTEAGLLYVPFKLQNYFYTDTSIGAVSLEKTLLPDM